MEAVIEFLNKLASKGIKLSANQGRLDCYAQKGTLTDELRSGIAKHKLDILALLERRDGRPSLHTDKSPLKGPKEVPVLASLDEAAHVSFWQQQLNGELLAGELIPDFPCTASISSEPRVLVQELPAELYQWVQDYGKTHSLPASVIFAAAFQLLLHKYTNQDDIIVGIPVARLGQNSSGAVGQLTNLFPLRTRFEEQLRMSDLFSRVQSVTLDVLSHSRYQSGYILEQLKLMHENGVPVFQVAYAFRNLPTHDDSNASQQQKENPLPADVNLSLEICEQKDSIHLHLQYNAGLYRQATAQRLITHYLTLLSAISKEPDLLLSEYSIISEQEKRQLLIENNNTRADYEQDRCLHELFVDQVALNADKVAVICGEQTLTYQQLHTRSLDLALYLQSHGVRPDVVVGLCMERSPEMVVAMLAILQAGGAYVPLDPGYPVDRLAYMVEDSQAFMVLTQEKLEEKLSSLLPAATRLIAVDRQSAEIGERVAGLKSCNAVFEQQVKPHHLAYVIYTSGSTGQPKGVAIEHHSPVTLVQWTSEVYSREELAGVLASTSICFDLSVYEIFVTLANAGTIILVPNALALAGLSNKKAVTLINTVPSAIEELLRLGAVPDSVRTINLAGEPLSPALVDKIYDRTAVRRVYDLYGPSEDTTYSTYMLREKSAPATIGRPIANTQVYILDQHSHLQPIGVPGELHLAGAGLARGYLNRPELTREKFVANPFQPDTRMYKTGDLARWMDDGTIQYLGRLDTQVKLRGFRIELGEIESCLRQHSAIQDTAVIAQDQETGKQLVAFYRAKDTTADHIVHLSTEELRAHVLQSLPEYMVPAAFVSLAAIPLNTNGKVDRRVLARMDVKISSSRAYVAPRNNLEKQLVDIWAGVFHVAPDKIGVDDNFFELGGHSLLATQLIAKVRSQMNIDLPLKAVFNFARVAQLAELIPQLAKNEIPPIQPLDRSTFQQLALSFAQERLWFISQLEPDNTAYNLSQAILFQDRLDIDQLDQAINVILARHESLRTIFPTHEGQAHQVILNHADFRLERSDLTANLSPEERNRKAQEICRQEVIKPFDLMRGPLFRARVIKLSDREHILLLNMHHIIADGWSLDILAKEISSILESLRQGLSPELVPLPIQYVDYALWQRKWLQESGTMKQQLAYWQEKLAGAAESLDLATDFPRPAVQSLTGASHKFTLNAQLAEQMRTLARQEGATLYMIVLAAFNVLLYRYTGQSDICVGSPIANRQYAETEGLIGMFVNTLAMRSQIEGEDTFPTLLSQVKATCLDAYQNQDAPFEKVVELVRPERNLAISPIFQVMVVLQNTTMGLQDRTLQTYPLESVASQFDLTLTLTETPEGLSALIEYSTALYKPQTIERMAEHFKALCGAITATPAAKIRDLEYLGGAEKQTLLVDFNNTRADYAKNKCLHELFVAQVAVHSENTAVVSGDAELTYRQLYERSHKLALYLQSQGVKPDTVVGLCVERSPEMLVGLLGILQAGGAYLPLDPGYPEDRLAYMLADGQASLVITQEKLQDKVSALLPAGSRLVAMDRQRNEIEECVAGLNAQHVGLADQVRSHHLAYVIYTSGSTGQPKGVAIEHHSPVTLVHWASEVYSREELAGVLASTSLCFDLSVYEIFVTLANGGTIILVPNALGLIGLSPKTPVTLLNTSPSAMEELLRLDAIPDSVHTINLAGEPLSPALVDKIYGSSAVRKVYDLYGPSEDTTYSTFMLREKNAPATIGRPIANTQVYILDTHNHLQPIGVPGELHIAGDGLARGYLNRPQLTQEKFVVNPFQPGTRMYKTGDLARWHDDGTIQYMGRMDTQVKLRGFRIELGEIEARLNQHQQIHGSAVIAQGQGANRQLVAFYRAHATTAEQTVQLPYEDLRGHLLRTLPEYMVPAAFVSLATIPLNANGKVDRRALSRIEVKIASSRGYVAPRDDAETQLVHIWAEVLNLASEKIGMNDNFFELGGHSLLATQLIAKIRSRLNIDLPLKALFSHNSVAQLVELIAKTEKSNVPSIPAVDRTKLQRLPLSFAQERLWFIDQLQPGSAGYNLPLAVTLHGELETNQLQQAINVIVARHESLRTVFPGFDGKAQQVIVDKVEFKLESIDLSHHGTREELDHKATEICQTEVNTPFDLAQGPLLRGKVIQLAEREHILLLNMHHIITDGWSLDVMMKELSLVLETLRQGLSTQLEPLPIQYVDYAVWQRKWLEESGAMKRQLAYWQEKLAGAAESLDLATDYPRPGARSFAGATQSFQLDAQLAGRLKSLTQSEGATLYMSLLAAFKVLLYRYTGQNDICVGSPIANRQHGETHGLIGIFVNTLALRTNVQGEDSVSDLLSQVKAACLEAYEHQDAPFEKVVDLVQPERNLAISPLFQVMVVLQNEAAELPQQIRPYSLQSSISKFDLTIAFEETAAGLAASIEYCTALFTPRTIERMCEHFKALCAAIVATPTAKIRDLQYLSDTEKQRLLVDFNNTRADYPRDKCIHDFFIEQVRNNPGRTAVRVDDQELTYQQLYDKSSGLALYLQSLGVKPDSVVGLCVERSLEMMVGIMGIVQAGAAYMPLDPDYPDERLAYMLEDSRAMIVLTRQPFKKRIGELVPTDSGLIALDEQWPEISERAAALKTKSTELREEVKPHNLSYLIYTSGSTGKPKGVLVEHGALVNRINWMQKSYPLTPADVVLQKTPYSFDVSVWEFFWPMMVGASLVFAAPDGHKDVEYLEKLINQENVTTLHFVPSMLHSFLENAQGGCNSVRQIFCSGEALDRKSVDDYKTRFPNAVMYNLYGPTEAAIDVTAYDCARLDYPFVPIGAPIDNTQIYILDAHNRPQPIGVPGELHIAGDGLARGYINRPELTQEKFVPNPFVAGTRMYKTGDLARWLDDGNIQYLGRIDTQVKIRGFRIELGEIEAQLNQHSEIQDSAVIAQGQGPNRQLISFYHAKETTAKHLVELPNRELREHLLRTLPEYMVPAAFVSVAAIPLSSNGKVDRRALARIHVTIASSRGYVAPRNLAENQLVNIWAEVLHLAPEKIGVDDNFFELGGHSLLATQVLAQIRTQFDIDLPLKSLFERTCVAQLAELIPHMEKSHVPSICPVDRSQFAHLPLSFAQERLWFIDQLQPDSAGYNLPLAVTLNGELDINQLEQAINVIIARHENLRTVFPGHDGQAQQLVLDNADIKLERIDLSHHTEKGERQNIAREICQREVARPFNLARGPLLRGTVIQVAEREHILLINMHHIVTDGWSLDIMTKELGLTLEKLRQGLRPQLEPLPIQYVDYAVWQRQWLEESGTLKQQLAYWQEKLDGAAESLDLATDYPRPAARSFAGASESFQLDAQLTGRLKNLSQHKNGTLFMVLLAAFKVLLHRYTGQNDICVGSPIANRQHAETRGLIGMFVNTLAMRSQVDGEDTFSALLSQVKATCLAAFEHQDAPFEKVVDLVRPERNLAISPIFQVMFLLQNTDMGALRHIQPFRLDSSVSKFDFTIAFEEAPVGLEATIEYSAALFKPQTIARMGEHFKALCAAIVATPTAKIRDLEYLNEAEMQRLLVDFNNTRADYPRDKCIHSFFIEQVRRNPGATAVRVDGQELSYQQLYEKSSDLALYLQSLGVKPDSVVGLCVERSPEMMVAIMGIMQAGGAYLPVDPAYPDDRLEYMLQDSQAVVVLTQERFRNKIKSLLMDDVTLIALDRQWPEISQRAAALKAKGTELRGDVKPHNLSYLIYTSGSTGKPKGVLVEHRALVNRLHWMQKRYGLKAADVVLQKTPYSFDVSVWEFFWPMMVGATLVFAAPDGHKDVEYLEKLINQENVTTLHFVPSMLHSFLENAQGGCNSVRRIFCSGEALDRKSVDRYRMRFTNAELHNLYGPTEAAIDVTAYDCAQLDYPFVPIGAPIDNTQIYILDAHNRPQPIGVPGELHIAGDGLARGYINRPELTQEKFVPNPFVAGTRMYKTGDLARWLDDGNIQYLGRIDTQVKIRGFRIELGEIEAQLNQHSEIQDSAVIAQGQGANRQLIAFYRAKDTQAEHLVHLPYKELRAHLQRTLPEYMVPAAFVSLAAIPLSSNGKVDRRVLSRKEVKITSAQEYVAPRNNTEKQLVDIWARVLKLAPEKIGVNDSFFELGGHSLLAVRMVEQMKQQGLHVRLQSLFTSPTLAKLAAAVENDLNAQVSLVDSVPDLEHEATLDPAIVLRTEGSLGEMRNIFLTGATGFLGAFLLSDLLAQTEADIYCLVRDESIEAGYRRIEERLHALGLRSATLRARIFPVLGDLSSPLLGLSRSTFNDLAAKIDVIYHSGATVNFFYPYALHKAANVVSTEDLLRMASFGRSKSIHFISTLSVALAQQGDGTSAIISERDPLPGAPNLSDGYVQSKWVAEKIVAIAGSRGFPVVIHRPGTIMGHSKTGMANLEDFVPSFIRGCMQAGCVPDIEVHDELHLMPVDFLSSSIVAISKRQELFGRVFNITSPQGITGRELVDALMIFDSSLQKVNYQQWTSRIAGNPGNALGRFVAAFPERATEQRSTRPVFDSEETLSLLEGAGLGRPKITQQLLEIYFSFIAEHSVKRSAVGAD